MANLTGQTIGPYRILEQIGMGGMATVYKAYQPSMDRHVAVKILPPHFMQDPTFVERFEREARTIARLEHPHILPVHDYGETDDGIAYIVMRYIEAGTLSDILKVKTLALDEAVRMFNQIADALAYAHEQGVIHRDMKPSNVLVDPRGQTFLTDFGLARMMEGTSQLTGSMILGTPTYMAPEQGEGKPADTRSDIYSLGIILYEMTTGRLPYEAETPLAVMLKHITDPLPLPRELNPNLPEGVELVLLKALAKEPDDRYQTVEDFMAALKQAVNNAPTMATPFNAQSAPPPSDIETPPPTPPGKKSSRLPVKWQWLAGAGAVFLFCCCLLGIANNREASNTATDVPDQAIQTKAPAPTQPSSQTNPSQSPSAPLAPTPGWTHFTNSNDIRALIARGNQLWAGTSGGILVIDQAEDSYNKLTTLNGLHYHSISSLLLDDEANVWVGTGPDPGLGVLQFDGKSWDYFDEVDGLTDPNITFLSLSAQGDILAGTTYNRQQVNVFNGLRWQAADLPPWPVDSPEITGFFQGENNETVVALGNEGGLLYYEGQGDEWLRLTTANGLPSNTINAMSFAQNGQMIIVTDAPGGIGFYNGEVFTTTPQLEDVVGSALYTAWDSNTIWLGTEQGQLIQFEDGEATLYTQNDGLPGGTITTISQTEDGTLWFNVAGQGLFSFDGDKFSPWQAENEPPFNNASQIVQVDNELWFVEQWGGEEIGVYNLDENTWDSFTAPGSVRAITVDPDNNIWYGTDDGLWRVTPEGEEEHFSAADGLPGNEITALAFDEFADGLWVGTTQGLALRQIYAEDASWLDLTAELPGPYVASLYADPNGSIWIGTERDDNDNPPGAARAQGDSIIQTWTAGEAFSEDIDAVTAFALDANDRLWAGTWGGGAWYLDDVDNPQWQPASPDDETSYAEILNITPQPDGTVWFGAWYGGLWGYNPDDGWWQDYPDDGVPGLAVFASHLDDNGHLWVSTESGIGRWVEE